MAQDQEQFEDDSLKATLKREWPGDGASEMTRARVAGLFRAPAPAARRTGWWVARAAGLLLAGGLVGMLAYWGYEAYEHWEYIEANRDRFGEMARIHAADASAAVASFSGAAEASQRLRRPVASVPPGTAWTLRSAGTYPFFGQEALRLEFVRGAQRISVMSIPASALVDAHDGFSYVEQVGKVTLAGAVRGDQLFCVIGDGAADREAVTAASRELITISP